MTNSIATRFDTNPLITPTSGAIGDNINGPSVIAAPPWLEQPLDSYYLYFAHHNGSWIRLATAPHPGGPWTVQPDHILPIEGLTGSGFHGHIASPDVHVDTANQRILMFFHAPAVWQDAYSPWLKTRFSQLTGVAAGHDGRTFTLLHDGALSFSYLRTFTWQGQRYGLSACGLLYRDHPESWPTGKLPFEERDQPIGHWRHCAVQLEGNRLFIFFTRWGDCPERIVASTIDLTDDWHDWHLTIPIRILHPTGALEGANEACEPSERGCAQGPVHQLRDPYVFIDADQSAWLYYSHAGEQGISLARLADDWQEQILKAAADPADSTELWRP